MESQKFALKANQPMPEDWSWILDRATMKPIYQNHAEGSITLKHPTATSWTLMPVSSFPPESIPGQSDHPSEPVPRESPRADRDDGSQSRNKGKVSFHVRMAGLVASVVALMNICFFDNTVNGLLAPNVSTLLANHRGHDLLLLVSRTQAVLVPAAHVLDCCRALSRKQAISWPSTLNVAIWSLCSWLLCGVVQHPLCLDSKLREEGLHQSDCSSDSHSKYTMGLFAIPVLGVFASCFVGVEETEREYNKFVARFFQKSQFFTLSVIEIYSFIFLLQFQWICGKATEYGGWLAMLAFCWELIAIGLLLLGGAVRMRDEPAMIFVVLSTVALVVGFVFNGVSRLGLTLGSWKVGLTGFAVAVFFNIVLFLISWACYQVYENCWSRFADEEDDDDDQEEDGEA